MLFSWKGGIRLIDEDVSRRTIAVSIKATKLTGRVLAQACLAVGRKIKKAHRARQTPHGKQTVRQLMGHGAATNSIEVESPKDFDRVARRWNVDYAFYKTGPDKYLLFFKSGQADAITACFSEYSRRVMKRSKSRRVPIREQLKRAAAELARQPSHKKERAREAVHEDRYFDEFHILLRDALTASYFVAVWKMLRKKGCVPSALTQNVKDLLASREIEAILDNTDFMILLSQAQSDRAILAKQLGISEHQLSYITHSNSGEGLLFYGDVTIPFVDRFPRGEIYNLLTTRPEDLKNEAKTE